MAYGFYIILFLFGLGMGSFLNVLSIRYNPDGKLFDMKRLGGRSHCMHCNHGLRWFDLLPLVSFILLAGRCRYCGKSIAWQYPLVELLSGLVFLVTPIYLNSFYSINTESFLSFDAPLLYYSLVILWILVLFTLLAMSVIDIREYLIPNELNLLLGIFGVLITVILSLEPIFVSPLRQSFFRHYSLMFSSSQNILLMHLLGMIVGGLLFGLLAFSSRGRAMGYGDVKLGLAAGIALGWPDIVLAMILSFILGGLAGVSLILSKKKSMRDLLPFAPFFVLGFVITFFFGAELLNGYFSAFGVV
ncbi:prepilin peptidase [Candidatus Peregrinibacteria bacterium]|nr:prepilin peptidase [Candidatus Peregrinibacteria bacterium]MBI5732491.1 prepilin peptidase [Candidatus Jorgensenbacteria bacterium]